MLLRLKIYGLSNIFFAFPPHTNYLILLHLRSSLLPLPERIWKFQAGIAPILLKFFSCLQPDFFWVWPNSFDAWGLEVSANLHHGCVEEKWDNWKNSTWVGALFKIKNKHFESRPFLLIPSVKEKPKFNAWPQIQWPSLFNSFFLNWLVKHFMARTKKAMAEC